MGSMVGGPERVLPLCKKMDATGAQHPMGKELVDVAPMLAALQQQVLALRIPHFYATPRFSAASVTFAGAFSLYTNRRRAWWYSLAGL